MNSLRLVWWKTGWIAQPLFSLLKFPFYEEIQSSPLETKQDEKQGLLASPQPSRRRAVWDANPSVRWRAQLISSYTEGVPECFKTKMFVYRVVYLKQFPYDARQLEKETLSDDSSV